jgi:hypothetical protein
VRAPLYFARFAREEWKLFATPEESPLASLPLPELLRQQLASLGPLPDEALASLDLFQADARAKFASLGAPAKKEAFEKICKTTPAQAARFSMPFFALRHGTGSDEVWRLAVLVCIARKARLDELDPLRWSMSTFTKSISDSASFGIFEQLDRQHDRQPKGAAARKAIKDSLDAKKGRGHRKKDPTLARDLALSFGLEQSRSLELVAGPQPPSDTEADARLDEAPAVANAIERLFAWESAYPLSRAQEVAQELRLRLIRDESCVETNKPGPSGDAHEYVLDAAKLNHRMPWDVPEPPERATAPPDRREAYDRMAAADWQAAVSEDRVIKTILDTNQAQFALFREAPLAPIPPLASVFDPATMKLKTQYKTLAYYYPATWDWLTNFVRTTYGELVRAFEECKPEREDLLRNREYDAVFGQRLGTAEPLAPPHASTNGGAATTLRRRAKSEADAAAREIVGERLTYYEGFCAEGDFNFISVYESDGWRPYLRTTSGQYEPFYKDALFGTYHLKEYFSKDDVRDRLTALENFQSYREFREGMERAAHMVLLRYGADEARRIEAEMYAANQMPLLGSIPIPADSDGSDSEGEDAPMVVVPTSETAYYGLVDDATADALAKLQAADSQRRIQVHRRALRLLTLQQSAEYILADGRLWRRDAPEWAIPRKRLFGVRGVEHDFGAVYGIFGAEGWTTDAYTPASSPPVPYVPVFKEGLLYFPFAPPAAAPSVTSGGTIYGLVDSNGDWVCLSPGEQATFLFDQKKFTLHAKATWHGTNVGADEIEKAWLANHALVSAPLRTFDRPSPVEELLLALWQEAEPAAANAGPLAGLLARSEEKRVTLSLGAWSQRLGEDPFESCYRVSEERLRAIGFVYEESQQMLVEEYGRLYGGALSGGDPPPLLEGCLFMPPRTDALGLETVEVEGNAIDLTDSIPVFNPATGQLTFFLDRRRVRAALRTASEGGYGEDAAVESGLVSKLDPPSGWGSRVFGSDHDDEPTFGLVGGEPNYRAEEDEHVPFQRSVAYTPNLRHLSSDPEMQRAYNVRLLAPKPGLNPLPRGPIPVDEGSSPKFVWCRMGECYLLEVVPSTKYELVRNDVRVTDEALADEALAAAESRRLRLAATIESLARLREEKEPVDDDALLESESESESEEDADAPESESEGSVSESDLFD